MSFWSQPLEQYFPMEVPPGSHSTLTRWRRMAAQWCSTGVARRIGSQLEPRGVDPGGQIFYIGPGAVWVNGFYAANSGQTALAVPGTTGLVVARYQPELQEVHLLWRPGVGIGGEIKDPEGWYEAPLYFLDVPNGLITDVRRLVPIPWAPPPVTEMPGWVPRGLIGTSLGPGAPAGPGHVNVHVAYPYTWPRFVVGRNYRVRCSSWFTSSVAGTGIGGQVRLYCRDRPGGGDQVERDPVVLFQGGADIYSATFMNTSLVVTNAGPEFVVVLTSEPWSGLNPQHVFAPWSTRIELEDVSGP